MYISDLEFCYINYHFYVTMDMLFEQQEYPEREEQPPTHKETQEPEPEKKEEKVEESEPLVDPGEEAQPEELEPLPLISTNQTEDFLVSCDLSG